MKPKKPTKIQAAKIETALDALGVIPFRNHSDNPKRDAQLNLAGKTFYATDETLSFFKSKILRSGRMDWYGWLYYIIESVGSKEENPSRNRRFVVFDVFGEVLSRSENWYATTDQALSGLFKFKENFDLAEYYFKRIKRQTKFLKYQAVNANKALR